MGAAAEHHTMTATEYLAWERAQPARHEFHHGEVFAMAGGSPRHNFLCTAVGAELRAVLRGVGCTVLSSDQRIAAVSGERYVYADAVAVCGAFVADALGGDVLANPTLVVEVLSARTEAYDRGEKWAAYQRIASVRDYLLVSQRSPLVEHFARQPDGTWRYAQLGPGGVITLRNGATVQVDAIFDGAFALPADEG
jgi:Uma2 family endonuclease